MDSSAEPSGGLSSLDFEHLSLAERTVIRAILRQREVDEAKLVEALADLPDAEQLSVAEMEQAIAQLLEQQHVLILEGEPRRYKVNLRPKHTSSLRRPIWDALQSTPGDDQQQARSERRRRIPNVWEALDEHKPRRDLPNFSDQGNDEQAN